MSCFDGPIALTLSSVISKPDKFNGAVALSSSVMVHQLVLGFRDAHCNWRKELDQLKSLGSTVIGQTGPWVSRSFGHGVVLFEQGQGTRIHGKLVACTPGRKGRENRMYGTINNKSRRNMCGKVFE